jgi:hypothetical protein
MEVRLALGCSPDQTIGPDASYRCHDAKDAGRNGSVFGPRSRAMVDERENQLSCIAYG